MAIIRLHFLVAYEFVLASPTAVCDSSKQCCPLADASMVSEQRHYCVYLDGSHSFSEGNKRRHDTGTSLCNVISDHPGKHQAYI